jgi:radical SAM superfamily enzyme YgiQ (UPF0313 family)
MFNIILINMPFGDLRLPSIGLTQIKAVLDKEFESRIVTRIVYSSHDFAHYVGVDVYDSICSSLDHHNAGLGDWFFRQIAFPFLKDNTEEYFTRYYPFKRSEPLKELIRAKREGLDTFIDHLIDRDGLDQANIVGFTSMFMQNVACFAMAQKLKERNPHLLTVIGGANCETPMGQEIVRHVDQIDYVFSGPGLKNFPAFVRACQKQDMEECESINGVFTKRNCSQPLTAPENPHQSQPDVLFLQLTRGSSTAVATSAVASVARPAIGLLGEELDINTEVELNYDQFLDQLESRFPDKQIDPILLFETSRGCWWGEKAHCTFCGLNGASMNYRAMSPEKAMKLFKSMFRYADRCNIFNCVDNIMAKNYLTDVFPYLETPPNVHLFYEVKADLTASDMEILSRARVKIIQPGIESLATSTLKLMKKGTSAFQNIYLLKNCLSYDICPQWNLLVGFPGEGDDVYEKYLRDLPLLVHLPPPSGVLPVRFDRYSPYYVRAKEYQLDLEPVDFYELIYPLNKESLANLAYYFSDTNLRAKYFLTMMKWLGKVREKYNSWRSAWKEDAPYPQLFLKREGNEALIHDTRSGSVIEYPISDVSVQVLELLSRPQRIGNLSTELGHLPGFDAAKEIAQLQEKGLLFQEHNRYLSLVLPRELPRLSFIP